MATNQRISRGKWPWGRTSPRRRVQDIDTLIEKNRGQIPVIEDQAREAIRRIEKNIDALVRERDLAEEFVFEETRARNKSLAYELASYGQDAIQEVEDAVDQERLFEDLQNRLQAAKSGSVADPEDEDLDTFFT